MYFPMRFEYFTLVSHFLRLVTITSQCAYFILSFLTNLHVRLTTLRPSFALFLHRRLVSASSSFVNELWN